MFRRGIDGIQSSQLLVDPFSDGQLMDRRPPRLESSDNRYAFYFYNTTQSSLQSIAVQRHSQKEGIHKPSLTD